MLICTVAAIAHHHHHHHLLRSEISDLLVVKAFSSHPKRFASITPSQHINTIHCHQDLCVCCAFGLHDFRYIFFIFLKFLFLFYLFICFGAIINTSKDFKGKKLRWWRFICFTFFHYFFSRVFTYLMNGPLAAVGITDSSSWESPSGVFHFLYFFSFQLIPWNSIMTCVSLLKMLCTMLLSDDDDDGVGEWFSAGW